MKKKKKEISRRSFLKAAPAIGVSAVSATLSPDANASPLRVPIAEYGREKAVPVLCEMCVQRCPANAYVKDGKVVRMEASPVHEYKGICGRSRSAASALYSDDRITTPLIRTGERGEGKFRQASWEEALDLIGEKLKKLRNDGEPENAIEPVHRPGRIAKLVISETRRIRRDGFSRLDRNRHADSGHGALH